MADLPIWNSFQDSIDRNVQRGSANLQQVGALQGILAKIQAAKQEQQFRAELSQAKTPEEQAAVAARYSGAPGILQHADRVSGQQATKEAAMARLQAAAQNFQQNFQLRMGAAKTAEEKLALQQQAEAFKQQLQGEAARLAGARANYDFGFMPAAVPSTTVGVTAPQQTQGGVDFNFGGMRGTVPDESSALALGQRLGFGGGAAPAAPVAQPVAAPEQPLSAPNNLGARDLGAWSRGRPVMASTPTPAPGVAPVAQAPAKPPEYASWPQRKKDEYDSRQSLAQTRPSIAGNAPISPETANRIAEQALSGDFSGASGWSRNMTAKAQIEDAITRLSNERGKSGGDLTGAKAMTAANRVALTASTKDLIAIQPFKAMLDQNADIAMGLGRKIADDKTNSAFVNRPLLWVKNNMGDRPDIAEYLAQMHIVEVEAARVLTQPRLVGQLTDQAISDMKSVVSGNMTIASTEAVLNRIKADGNNRINAIKSAQARTLAEIRGQQPRTRDSDKPKADQFFK